MTIGERIKYLRERADLTQEELGRMVGVQKSAIHKYESGLVVNIKQPTIEALAVALGVTPAALLGFEETEADRDARMIQEVLLRRPGMRILFDACRDVDDETLQKTADMIESLKRLSGK